MSKVPAGDRRGSDMIETTDHRVWTTPGRAGYETPVDGTAGVAR
jgi:hypothetical protein